MVNEKPKASEIRTLQSRIAALEQLIEVYEDSVVEQTDKLFGEIAEHRRDEEALKRAKEDIQRLNEALEAKIEQTTKELSDAQEELLRRERLNMLGIVAANVGNELRNPLGVMNNAVYYLGTLLAGADETVREYLGIIGKEIEVSQRVLSDFIDFFRGAPPMAREVPVGELIDQSLAACEVPGNVAVSVEIPEPLPVVKVDPSQMKQVLRNLITNAAQAMPQGGALRLAARRVAGSEARRAWSGGSNPEPRSSVEISVADSGAGIPPENMKKVFQPLFSTKARGIGLGLSICKSFTEANGGGIEVESEPGKGTTFTVKLPVDRVAR